MQIEENQKYNSKKYLNNRSLRVDLTPMVDLGFLLISFFIVTTVLSQPTISKLIMPKDEGPKTLIKENAVLTISLMRNDSIVWYEGLDKNTSFNYCRYNNLRSLIQQKQKKVAKIFGDASQTIIIIYPGIESTYKNFINILDELQINGVTHYFVINPNNKVNST